MTRDARRLVHDDQGAIAVVVLFMAVLLVAGLFCLVDLGSTIVLRERMQAAADSAAFSSAVVHARGMNLIAAINMVMAALLAVLVALNLMETVIIVGMAAIAACMAASFGLCAPAATALPILEEARTLVATTRDAVREPILSALQMLHVAERGLRVFIPYASELAALQALSAYSPPARVGIAIPPRATLPVADDTYTELCGRAGKLAADLAMKPFAGIGPFITGPAEAAIRGLAESNPAWFCAGTTADAKARTFKQKVERVFPRTQAQADCEDADLLAPGGATTCKAAAAEAARSRPDEITGNCVAGCEPAQYAWRSKHARVECDPNEHPKRRAYIWQERTVIRHYLAGPGGLRAVPSEDEPSEPRLRSHEAQPCPRDERGRVAWSRAWPDAASEAASPVCSFVTHGEGSARQTVVEVLHVLQCQEQVAREREIEDLSHDPALGAHDAHDSSRSPQRLEAGITRGSDALQIRSAIVADAAKSYAGAIRTAAWGHAAALGAIALPAGLERLQVAQAEYYFARAADPREWLWSTHWKARLRRFRLQPENAGADPAQALDEGFHIPLPSLDFATGCMRGGARNTDPAKPDDDACGGLRERLQTLSSFIVH